MDAIEKYTEISSSRIVRKRVGWKHGVDFQIVSFQAVMAELLDGDTIHHALGLDWSGDRTQSLIRAMECAGRSLQWRWLILDEFSMVSAELLAQLELRCRELLRDLSMAKYDRDGKIRPFGGLNVILAGDLYQLPPPKRNVSGRYPLGFVGRTQKHTAGTRTSGPNPSLGQPHSRHARCYGIGAL